MEFHETVRGARFYDGHIPQLIDNLERVAVALEKLVEKDNINKEGVDAKKMADTVTRPPFYKAK